MEAETPTAMEIAVTELGEVLSEETDADISVDVDERTVSATGDGDAVLTAGTRYAVRYASVATHGADEEVELLYDVHTDGETVRFENIREA